MTHAYVGVAKRFTELLDSLVIRNPCLETMAMMLFSSDKVKLGMEVNFNGDSQAYSILSS